jgi:Flp pilus assembly protein TadG
MKKLEKNKKINFENGQSMIELAVSLVVLLILISGIVDFGRVAFYYISMRDSAQEGASYGSICPTKCNEIEERVKAGAVDESRVQISIEISGNKCTDNSLSDISNGDLVIVSVLDPNFPMTMPLIGVFLGRQDISLETSINDQVIRVSDCN